MQEGVIYNTHMTVYVFGNPDQQIDNLAFTVAKHISKIYPQIKFVNVSPNADLPFAGKKSAIILDTVAGIDKVTTISDSDLDKLITQTSTSAHDYDLGFQLKYLKKLDLLPTLTIICIPQNLPLDYDLIQFTFKKLVAQDIHGS
jgi:hypothetical protein